ncbi:MAG: serine O-acetyltransferase [Micavibrio sp.]|nr:serine O-acetyltransferase [Micavibrio sp.]|tara:strand:+ start:1963 stop:2610 length:648 start_codon:yes stop_codon:yes gene_type:complete
MMDLIKSIQERDAAKPSVFEVFFAYNGFHAVVWHRLNNFLWDLGLRAVARILSNIARILTGIEIHPEAKIGARLFIDHGTGVVIGQTAIVGNDVTLYHGVTLGGVGRDGDNGRRHPTVEDGVMIGAGAQVLGGITVGEKAKIGANSVVTQNIPANVTALGIPARVVGSDDRARPYGMPSKEELDQLTSKVDTLFDDVKAIKIKAKTKKATSKDAA